MNPISSLRSFFQLCSYLQGVVHPIPFALVRFIYFFNLSAFVTFFFFVTVLTDFIYYTETILATLNFAGLEGFCIFLIHLLISLKLGADSNIHGWLVVHSWATDTESSQWMDWHSTIYVFWWKPFLFQLQNQHILMFCHFPSTFLSF